MDNLSRRALLFGGAAAASQVALPSSAMELASAAGPVLPGPYIWALDPLGVVVPNATWTLVPWPVVPLNTTTAFVDPDGATWIFPADTASGIWAMVANVAWDNARSPSGVPITPVTHRKLARVLQQDTGTPQIDQIAYAVSSTDLTYHADLSLRGDQRFLGDGSLGLQQQQVYIQTGVRQGYPDQRIWIEVYQDSGQPLLCRFDGTNAPKTATRPPVVGYQAPSFMVVKVCEF